MKDFRFDIIIPNHERPSALKTTLDRLLATEAATVIDRIWVIENGRPSGAESVCEKYSGQLPITYLYSAEPGLAEARNVGIRHSSADLLLFIDDDVRPFKGALSAYAEAFSRYGRRAFFGGPVEPEYVGKPPKEWLIDSLPYSAKGFSLGPCERKINGKPTFLGGNFAVPRSAFEEFGLFEGPSATGRLGGGLGEETRLQERLLAQSFDGIYLPAARVAHEVPTNNCDKAFVRRRRWRHGFGEGQMAAQNWQGLRKLLSNLFWLLYSAVYALAEALIATPKLLNEEENFRHQIKLAYSIGKIAGYLSGSIRKP